MASISERENREIEAANASDKTPVVFIHGLWVLPSSWANWADFFTQAGFAPLTPDWPGDPATVAEARANPKVLAKKTLKQIADHTTEIINALDKKPVVMGHSTGGLLAQMLAGRGLSAATVAIDPGVFRGVLPLPASVLKGVGPFLVNPLTRGRAITLTFKPVQVRLGERARRARGEGALRRVPRRLLRDGARADGQREPQPVDAGEGEHEEPRPRPTPDHRRREGPHGAVGDRARRLQAAEAQHGVTEIVKMPNRGHALTIDHGWRDVAQTALDFVERSLPAATTSLPKMRNVPAKSALVRRLTFASVRDVQPHRRESPLVRSVSLSTSGAPNDQRHDRSTGV